MNKLNYISKKDYDYYQYQDYSFKRSIQKHANGVLKFLKIPYEIHNIILSEIADTGPQMHRLDFAGEAMKGHEEICLILECQSTLPTDEDIKRFFQYVSSIRILKNKKVELYILCTKETSYQLKEFELKDDCIYTMHIISLKHIEANEILKNIENKIKYNQEITEADIAALELIIYTNFEETKLEILQKTLKLVEQLEINANEKEAIIYILDVLSANMLDNEEQQIYVEERKMLINPRERYLVEKTRDEVTEELTKKNKKEIEKIEQERNQEIEKIEQERNQEIEKKYNIVKNLINKGFETKEILEITDITEEEFKKITSN